MDSVQKFQNLLKGLFQFDTSDLDFGIYRILNYKRDQIEKFIEEDLVNKVEFAFAHHKDERLEEIGQRFEGAKEKVIEGLGKDAFTPAGEIREEFKNTPLGRDYLSIKAQKEEAETIDEIKLQVFNDLYSFFSRFYEEGDFVPQYRYSIKGHKYAIPYNGEEVKLYWANQDQYYTKTGLLFRDYAFKADGYKIVFRTVKAAEELGSNKATKERFFILDGEMPVEKADGKTLVIRFQYRELSVEEVKDYHVEGGSNTSKQEKINQKSYEDILKKVGDINIKASLSKDYKPVLSESEGNEKPLLIHQISRFAAKNTKDYFIHKNLKKFLSEQLDYFIKAEVLSIETLEKERFLDKHITRAKVVRGIGEDIIDFLAQIEDFQKRLWEKKKFVLKTEYVITIDRIPEEFHEEILKNDAQLKEWEELGFGKVEKKEELIVKRDLRVIEYKKLPVDTRYFSQGFKEKLLDKLTEQAYLDDLLDGLLIKSENWQALSLLLIKHKEEVQTVYIDPPFNLGTNADFLYNVNYKDSTWISLLGNRLELARNLLDEKGSIFVRCDYNGNMLVRVLMNEVFNNLLLNEVIIKRGRETVGTLGRMDTDNEYLYLYGKSSNFTFNDVYTSRPVAQIQWTAFLMGGERKPPERVFFGKKLLPPKGQHFPLSQEKVDKLLAEFFIRLRCIECGVKYYYASSNVELHRKMKTKKNRFKFYDVTKDDQISGIHDLDNCNFCNSDNFKVEYLGSPEQKINNLWLDIESYSRGYSFQTENSEQLLKRAIRSTSNQADLILDFFLGSGTTTAVAHKLNRKWVGIEMGEHFWTRVLPRMKKVLAYDKRGISREKDVKEIYNQKTAGGFFKYQILEQYEDTLDNIELTSSKQAELKFGEDYLLKYFLDYETRENSSLLNIDQVRNPFSYKLKVNLEELGEPQEMAVDLPETFNYLLGLKVKKAKARNNGRRYLFVLGEKGAKDIAIVWREYEEKWSEDDFRKDKEFIIKELEPWTPHIVYVNGQSVLTPKLGEHSVEIRYIEPEFKKLMEG